MAYHDIQYINLVRHALESGDRKPNRTGVDSLSAFGYQMRFDLRDGTIPLLTTKKMHTRSIIHEILWYLQGADNIKYLKENNVTIWDEWADANGDLGPVYGKQWRAWPDIRVTGTTCQQTDETTYSVDWNFIDQIAILIDKLKTNPNDRRLIVSAWNVGQLTDMALPPCHYAFQCYARPLSLKERLLIATKTHNADDILMDTSKNPVELVQKNLDVIDVPKYELSLMLNQRSCDIGLGVPFNIVQYSILLRMFCEVTNMVPGDFIWNGGDAHIYVNHITQLMEQRTRVPYESPTFRFARKISDIDDFKYEDFIIENYQFHPTIKMDVAI
jgi:thymidylate synthase